GVTAQARGVAYPTFPVTSPRLTPPAVARIVTVSPSWRNVLVSPLLSLRGSAPFQVSSISEPRSSRRPPGTVPLARRCPVRSEAPLTVGRASSWSGGQYMLRYGGRETPSPLSSISRVMSSPQSSFLRR